MLVFEFCLCVLLLLPLGAWQLLRMCRNSLATCTLQVVVANRGLGSFNFYVSFICESVRV